MLKKIQKSHLFGGSILALSIALTSAPATYAQDSEVDEVVVTGSRIAVDSPEQAVSPVVSFGASDIKSAGKIDVTELLRESPALQGSLPGSFSAFNGEALGVGQLDLRSLGARRTLVLQNGRRHVAGISGSGTVDVNTISTSLLDRVDVLTGGASSIYGADAVTGVVNFIMRDGSSFDGFEVRAQAGVSSEGDGEEFFASIANGGEFANGRGDFVIGAEYSGAREVISGDRDFAGSGLLNQVANNDRLQTALGTDPRFSNVFVPNLTLPISSAFGIISLGTEADPSSAFVDAAFGSGTPGCGRTVGSENFPGCQVFDNGTLRPYNPGDIFIGGFEAIGGDAVPTDPDDEILLPKTDRFVINAETSYEFAENINFFASAKYAFSETQESNQVNGFNDDIPIANDNPFIPVALRAQLDSLIADGETPRIVISRDTLDLAGRPNPISERKTLRLVGGFEGAIPALDVDYEVSLNYGRTDADITTQNTRIEDRFFAGIDAVTDPATGEIVCRSDIDPTAPIPEPDFPSTSLDYSTFNPQDGSCRPINIFGTNAITEEAAAFAFLPTTSSNEVEQLVFFASIAGDTGRAFELPAGPIDYVLGFEYRDENSQFISDGLVQSGLTFGSNNSGPTLPVSGSYDVYEGFAEVRVPVLTDMPFADFLELNSAIRISDYSTIGSAEAWSVGGRWGFANDFTARVTWSEAVRAPNVNELFSPLQPATIGATQDPCNANFIDAGTEFRAANCAQFVDADFESTNFNSAFVPGQTGGNLNLNEETAETLTIGAVWQPTGNVFEGLTAIVDYYDIEIDGLIDTLGAFQIAQNCVDAPTIDNQFCDQVFRDPTDGFITGFLSGEVNLGSVKTEGIDFQLRYGFDLGSQFGLSDAGRLSLGLVGTHFLTNEEVRDPSAPEAVTDIQGTFTRPDWITNFNVNWDVDKFGLGWRVRYEGSQLVPGVALDDVEGDPDFINPLNTGDSFVHDFTVSYELREDLEFYGGVNNAFDREPYIASLSRPAGPRGRFLFAGVNATF